MRAELFTGDAGEWDAFVESTPCATAAHQFAWKRILSRVYGHDCPYLVVRDDGAIRGALPLVDVRSIAFGRYLVSMPFLNAGGPLGDEPSALALASAACDLGLERRVRLVELRCTREVEMGLPDSREKVACVLPLPSTAEALWSGFPSKLRSQVRKPQKEGMEVRFGADQLEPFYAVFARNMRDLGSPAHPRRFFRILSEELGERVWFACAYHKGVAVAGGCGLEFRGTFEITWASALREYNSLSPNMLLYWEFMQRAAQLGLEQFDFGRCTPNSGSHRFKLQWGAQDVPLHWYRHSTTAGATTPRQDEGGLSLASRLWQRMPVPLATMIGGRLRGGIPA